MAEVPGAAARERALLLENIHPDAIAALSKVGVHAERVDGALDPDELATRVRGFAIIGIRSKTEVTDRVLDAADSLLAIGAFCIGTNQIDLASASRRGIAVFNAPFSNTRSVVEVAVAEIIALTRRLTNKNADMHAGIWDKSADGSHELRGQRLGIIGYGNIGTQLSVLAENLGMTVFFYDVADKLALGNARPCATMAELLESVDVVTLHVDGRRGNVGLFGDFAVVRQADVSRIPRRNVRGEAAQALRENNVGTDRAVLFGGQRGHVHRVLSDTVLKIFDDLLGDPDADGFLRLFGGAADVWREDHIGKATQL